jgi:small subunit ribosomal protein S17
MASIAAKAQAGAKAGKSIVTPLIHSQKVGVVVSAGKMSRAVKVRVAGQEWNKKFRKVSLDSILWPKHTKIHDADYMV